MSRLQQNLLDVAEVALAKQEDRVAALRAEQLSAVSDHQAQGSGDMDVSFALDRRFRLVFVRAHFVGGTGAAPLYLDLDSAAGPAFDARLFTVHRAGAGRDVHLRITAEESADPSPWTFQAGDGVRLVWTNPDPGAMTWGVTVGLALAP